MISTLSIMTASAKAADPVIVADTTSFREMYDQAVPVSGSTVVGLRIGDAQGNVDTDDIRLPILSGESVCVRAVTQDGRFSSSNRYTSRLPVNDGTIGRLTPITLRYNNVLSDYSMDAFAMKAFIGRNGACNPEGSVHLPQILPHGSKRILSVLVNSSGRHALLRVAGAKPIPCSKIKEGARIAFDRLCTADITAFRHGITDVTIILDDDFGEETTSIAVMIPDTGN